MGVHGLHPKSTAGTRTVTTRRYAFDHDSVGPGRHWLDDDLIGSHLVAALSGVIPPGERFFADTIRAQRDWVEGPLVEQIKGFIGQERLHQREHDEFNHALARLGYPTAGIDRASQITFDLAERLPARTKVAIAAAIEHFTAVIAQHSLEEDQLAEWQLSESTRAFLAWHLVEELEHRAVAFDVMQAMGVGELERSLAMRIATLMMIPSVVGGFLVSLAGDRDTWHPLRLVRSLDRFRRSAIVRRSFLRDLLAWNRPGFHPDQRSIDDLLDQWRERLFAPDGEVTANSHHRTSRTG
jgi:predicted metal-dependent hydrolase